MVNLNIFRDELKKELERGEYKPQADEVVKNKNIYCKLCGDSRLWVSPDKHWYMKAQCKCQREAAEKAELQKEKERNFAKFKGLKYSSLQGERYKNVTFGSLDLDRPDDFIKAIDIFKDYARNWKQNRQSGSGIYIYGDYGTGKSLLTACLGNFLLKNLVPVIFTTISDIVTKVRDSFDFDNDMSEGEILSNLINVDLLIIDDLGAENLTKTAKEKIFQIINARYNKNMPTIFSSNYSLDQLLEYKEFEQRVIERIFEMAKTKIELRGTSYRLKAK